MFIMVTKLTQLHIIIFAYRNMVVRLLCSESQKTPTMKYLNETTTDQKYVRLYVKAQIHAT